MIPVFFTTNHLFIIVIAFIAGICWTPYPFWSGIALLTSFCMLYQEKNIWSLVTILCCFFFFGVTRYYQNRELYFANNALLEKNCNATATVLEVMPRLDEQEQICISLQLHALDIQNTQKTISKKVYLFLPYYTKVWLKPYQKIILKNIQLKHPNSDSYQEYLIRENIWAVTHQKKLAYTTLARPGLFMQKVDVLCQLPLHAAKHVISELTHTLYLSIFCGKKIKSTTTTMVKRLFQYWGISHHLARSGLHLVLLIGLLSFLLSCIPCSAAKKQYAIVCMLCIYYSATYSSIAFMRAFYMYIFYVLCKQLYLPSNPIHILLITALLVLTMNPHHPFFLDFQLSFSITLLILWFCQSTQNRKTIAS